MRSYLLLDGIVIFALLATPVNWAELEEPESAAFATGGADAGASSGLEGHWLNWNEVCSWSKLWRVGDGFLVVLAIESDSGPSPWGSWVRLRGNWSQNKEVGWSSLSIDIWSSCWFMSEGEEG